MEFTRLSQLTGDPKYYDAVQRISEYFQYQQNNTELPGMWPVICSPYSTVFDQGSTFGVGALADSLYEYLAKEYMLLGGGGPEYLQMYELFVETAKKHLFFRVSNPEGLKVQFAGDARSGIDHVVLEPRGQHLSCFIGGLVGLGARLRGREDDLKVARELTDGCIWAYKSMPSGIMPEIFHGVACSGNCAWDREEWYRQVLEHKSEVEGGRSVIREERLQPGFSWIDDRRYLLRPEAIESVFVMYRLTGDKQLLDDGWRMFEAIENAARTEIAYTEVSDVTYDDPPQGNKMESFWTGETLKYFYLLFSEPELISLDEYVFNTEAHPFRYR
jgi:mannosyl-oligosaccharide alpha-1,2-mannosidase